MRIISMHAYALRRPEYSVSPAGSLLHIHTFVLFFCKAQPDGSDGTDAYAYVTTTTILYYGSRQLNYPWQLQGSFGFTRYLCGSPFIEVNTNVEQIYKNVQLNCFEVEPPVYFR